MPRSSESHSQWIILLAGPILSVISFVVAYFIDPLGFGDRRPLAAVPAFLLAIVILLISHDLVARRELEQASDYSDRIYEAVKDYLHVTKVGSPEQAIRYVLTRLPILQEVRNTAFSVRDEIERVDEKLYESPAYAGAERQIAEWTLKGVRWKDIGDAIAVVRFRAVAAIANDSGHKHKPRYQYRLLSESAPQINFIILSYPDGTSEVLFNWDFRNIGQDPIVLLSRDRDILEMFAVQFEYLWRAASPDHDNTATSSTSKT
jgi:hypothetical protein